VDDEAGLTAMMEHLSGLAMATAPGAVTDAKALVRFLVDDATRPRTLTAGHMIDEHVMKETARRIAKRRASLEGREGLAAFIEKRKPEWNS
jgi:methylglutaconyl-CoA hydratase